MESARNNNISEPKRKEISFSTLESVYGALSDKQKLTDVLRALEPEEQEAFYQSWLDKTVPGRITLTLEKAVQAHKSGYTELEMIHSLEAGIELDLAKNYVMRESEGELTPKELNLKSALAEIFPNRYPFVDGS